MKILEYKIIATLSLIKLIELVNSSIKEGWQPFEVPFIETATFEMYYQTMVKYGD